MHHPLRRRLSLSLLLFLVLRPTEPVSSFAVPSPRGTFEPGAKQPERRRGTARQRRPPSRRTHPRGHFHRHGSKKRDDVDVDDGADEADYDRTHGGFDSEGRIDPLEIRLDATLLATFVLCRFLVYDVTTGIKATPGWELRDVIALLQTFSSAIVLSGLWTLVGVCATGIFRDDRDRREGDGGLVGEHSWGQGRGLLVTTILAAPAWIASEILLGWPTAGALWREGAGGAGGLAALDGSAPLVPDGRGGSLLALIGAGTLGVGCTMALGRYVRKYVA